jgi:nitric-oxide synthase, bacterial
MPNPNGHPDPWLPPYDAATEFLCSPEVGPAEPDRLAAVRHEIATTGTYRQNWAELLLGSRWAWRNADRCIGRLHWQSLRVLDRRDCTTAEEVADACVEHIRYSTNDGKLRPAITVFGQRQPDGGQIRIWNSQLIRYAGVRAPDGSIIGDPMNIETTELAIRLGWQPTGGRFDLLPLIIQMPGEKPKLFDVPRDAVLEVDIVHPDLPWFAELGLRWHALPAISDMSLEMGGLSYPAAPFSGWYMSTEIAARNFGDEQRYNLLPEVATRMGLDTRSTRTLWKDRALIELCTAVAESFRAAGVRMVDHHQASRQFVRHVEREREAGRVTPTDWSWIVPPVSSSTTATFHQYYDPPEAAHGPQLVHQTGLGPDHVTGEQLDAAVAVCPVAH